MSSINAINSTTGSSSSTDSSNVLPQQTLSQSDFLQLLVTQLTAQDPLNPQSDLDSIAQMAQFSSLQQSQQMEGNLAQMNATSMLGQTVTVQTGKGTEISGVVTGVELDSGSPQIIVNGNAYDPSNVVSIVPTTTTSSTNTANATTTGSTSGSGQ
jgi:flagellar basal-body rod modification protein FlgD